MKTFLVSIIIAVVVLGGGYLVWISFSGTETSDTQITNQLPRLSLFFTEPSENSTISVLSYRTNTRKWDELVLFSSNDFLALDTGNGFIVTDYFGDKGDTKYYSYSGELTKTYSDYQMVQYQQRSGISAFLARNGDYERLQLFVEREGQMLKWKPDDLDIPSNKNFDWVDIIDGHTVFYSYYESTGDAQHEMHLSKLDIQTGEHALLLDVPIEEDPQYLGYDPLAEEVFISRSLFQNGFFLESYNTTSQVTRELYRTATSYMLGHLPLRNNVIVFGEHTYGMSDQSLKKFNVITRVVDTILQGEYLPIQWIDDNHIIVMHDGASSVIDIRSGGIVDLGDEFRDHSTLYPLQGGL